LTLFALSFCNSPKSLRLYKLVSASGSAISICLLSWAIIVLNIKCSICITSGFLWVASFWAVLLVEDGQYLSHNRRYIAIVLLTILGVLAGGLLVFRWQQDPYWVSHDSAKLRLLSFNQLVLEDRPQLGRGDSPITVILFSSLYCGACRSELPKLKQLATTETGVRIVYRFYSSSANKLDEISASLTNEEFWPFVDTVCAAEWSGSNPSPLIPIPQSKAVLLTKQAEARRKIVEDLSLAETLKIKGTPTAIVLTRTRRQVIGASLLPRLLETEFYRSIRR
jgi:thiol-disulfide isomerase/thioredoxin